MSRNCFLTLPLTDHAIIEASTPRADVEPALLEVTYSHVTS